MHHLMSFLRYWKSTGKALSDALWTAVMIIMAAVFWTQGPGWFAYGISLLVIGTAWMVTARVKGYRAGLREQEERASGDRYQVIDGRTTFKRYPWS